ncbi:MAG: PAS domain S-box protein, partial [Prolixibacteraceae bacterium]
MNTMTADLIPNATLLITLILLYELLSRKIINYSYLSQIMSGFLFGGIAIIGMNMPINYTPGVFYDGRTIVLSLTGLFAGGITTVLSVVLSGSYRMYIGGPGIWAGLGSIVSSALIGYLFRRLFKRKPESIKETGLIAMGMSVHLAMLLCQLVLLPWPSGLLTVKNIWGPVILIFPAATLITGIFMRNGLRRIKAEANIRRSETLYRTTLHSIGDAVMTTDQNGDINFLNPVAERISGWKEKEVLGKPVEFVFHIIHEETEEQVDNPVRIALKEGRTIALANHTLLVTKQGRKIPIADSGAPIKDENERITGAVLVFRDQTDERAKQRQIRESRERFFRAVEHFPGLVIICDLDLNVQFVNETVQEITGRPPAWFVGKKEGFLWPEALTDKYMPVLLETIRTGKTHYLRTSVVFPRVGERHLDLTFIPLTDEKGTMHEIMGIVNDFTKEKQITDELREREVLYHTLTELSPVGIFRTLPDGYTTYVNPKWCQLSGLTPDQALGNDWLMAVHPDDRAELIENWQKAVRDHRQSVAHYRFLKPDGSQTWVLGETVPEITADGNILGYIGTITDITEQKKAEEMLVRSRENFRQSIDESPLGMRILTEAGDTLYLNKALLDIYGFSSLSEYLEVPASEKYTTPYLEKHLERKERRRRGENVESQYEIEIKRKDGGIRNVYVHRKMIYWDGQPQYLVIYQDQTERKQAEEA